VDSGALTPAATARMFKSPDEVPREDIFTINAFLFVSDSRPFILTSRNHFLSSQTDRKQEK
jgi:hypothetical protein